MIRRATLPALALLVASRSAAAAPAPEPPPPPAPAPTVDIDYRAPPGCPDRASFLANVQARRQIPRPDPRRFIVQITRRDGGVDGQLSVEETGTPQGSRAIRLLSGATCDEVVLALALTTALALDERPDPPPAPAAGPRSRLLVRAGADVAASARVGPDAMIGVPLFVDLALRRRGSAFSPSARLSLEYAAGGGGDAAGQAEFSWYVARLDLCPLDVTLTSTLSLTPCASVEGGSLGARGLAVNDAAAAHRPWLAPGAAVRLSWNLTGDIRLEVMAHAVAPLIRDTFTIAPDTTVHEVPSLTFTAAVGLALRLR